MLTAQGSAGFNPIITALQFTTRPEANFTVSNVWTGTAAMLLPPTLTSQGDFNHDGQVDSADYIVWRRSIGQTGASLAADSNGDYQVNAADLAAWRAHFGQAVSAAGAGAAIESGAIPEPAAFALALMGIIICIAIRVR
jgi:hypothetical protein